MTTPQHSNLGRGDRNKSRDRSLTKPKANVSVLVINESALSSDKKSEKASPIHVTDQKYEELH